MAARTSPPSNEDVASTLEDVAAVLEAQDANPHRVRAYREAARTLRVREATITTRLYRARLRLADSWRDEEQLERERS